MEVRKVEAISFDVEAAFRDWQVADEAARKEIEDVLLDECSGRQAKEFERRVSDWKAAQGCLEQTGNDLRPAAEPAWMAELDAAAERGWQEWIATAQQILADGRASPEEIEAGGWLTEGVDEFRAEVAKAKASSPAKALVGILPGALATPEAPSSCALAPESVAPAPDDSDAAGEIDWGKGGRSLSNAKIAIAKVGIRCGYDDFHKKYVVQGHPCMKGGSVSESLDNMALMVRNEISKTYKLDINKTLVLEALQIKCFEHAFDPVRDYLDGMRWDGRRRLDRWLVDYCGAEDTEYHRAVGRKVLIAAVRRARSPGCKFDYLMVLEGPQGAGKSTALQILAGAENFSDARVLKLRDKEQQEAIAGIWIYEIAELAGKHIDVEEVKAFLSKSVDAARAAYGSARTDQRRRCIFVATTNNDQYLKDDTGNRRFWPVRVEQIDLECLRLDRDQLWAEAAEAEASGESLVISAELWGAAAEATAERMEYDPWEGTIGAKLAHLEAVASAGKPLSTKLFARGEDEDGPHWRVASEYLLTDVLKIPNLKQTNFQTKRLAKVMKSIGWTSGMNALRFGGSGQKRGFIKLIEKNE